MEENAHNKLVQLIAIQPGGGLLPSPIISATISMTIRPIIIVCLGVFFTFMSMVSSAYCEALNIYFADVGRANATLFYQPGKCAMLVDTGSQESSEALLSVMRKAGVKALDFVVVTHPHKDHFGGLQSIADNYEIRELSDNGDTNEDEEGFVAYSKLQFSLPYSVLAKGDSWRCGDLSIEVLHPSAAFDTGDDYNSRSLALRMGFNSFRLLLMGDVSGAGERKMLQSSQEMESMVLHVGHHGESNSTSRELLERVKPKIAIISNGKEDLSRGVSQQVLDRLAANDVKTFRTDQEGTIHLRVAENGNIRLKP